MTDSLPVEGDTHGMELRMHFLGVMVQDGLFTRVVEATRVFECRDDKTRNFISSVIIISHSIYSWNFSRHVTELNIAYVYFCSGGNIGS